MLLDFFSRLIIAVIQVTIAAKVAFLFQKKSFHYQNKIREFQEKSNAIIEISSEISEGYTRRKIRTENLLEVLRKGDKEDLIKCRKSYRDSVENWNIILNKQNIALNNVKLYRIAKEDLEGDIHKGFREIHEIIKKEINKIDVGEKVSEENINNALSRLNETQTKTLTLTDSLLKKAREEMKKSEGCKEELSQNNLRDASIYELIKALYSRSNRFSIKCSFP